jgi:hypothetical protein
MGKLDLGGKPFAEAVGSEVNYKSTKDLIKNKSSLGSLSLGEWPGLLTAGCCPQEEMRGTAQVARWRFTLQYLKCLRTMSMWTRCRKWAMSMGSCRGLGGTSSTSRGVCRVLVDGVSRTRATWQIETALPVKALLDKLS